MARPNPVVWFEIYVQDMPRARAFYEQVLQTELAALPAPEGETSGYEMLAFPGDMNMAGGINGTLVKMDGVPSGGSTMVYFGCDDCAVELARVEAAGGKVFKPKFSIGPYGFCAIVVDTEGNMVGLHSMK